MTARLANLQGNAKRELSRESVRFAFGLNHQTQADEQTPPGTVISSLEVTDRLGFVSLRAGNCLGKRPLHTAAKTFLKDSLPRPR